ncbi:DUF523 domain-containing protein [Clostridium sp. MSJ-4]|uniref:DUF523 domain-containing protein n=1 Tax=Clostridium simiarum TaxID=2841506 RepID=A0ABS6EWN5_9CLOT|nr:DUF523 domain-containing protein [Clostridium simiarum]MBU5590640.1 DUF523 domain-containing protein [Clostridium simiarum]
MIIVSACLCGLNCKYNGKNNEAIDIIRKLEKEDIIPVCPEQLGGLPTPRDPSEISNGTGEEVLKGKGKVISINGEDYTGYFIKGAEETLKIAKLFQVKKAILKSNSPSCGYKKIYNGDFKGILKEGNGVTAQLLLDNGIEVISEKDLKE